MTGPSTSLLQRIRRCLRQPRRLLIARLIHSRYMKFSSTHPELQARVTKNHCGVLFQPFRFPPQLRVVRLREPLYTTNSIVDGLTDCAETGDPLLRVGAGEVGDAPLLVVAAAGIEDPWILSASTCGEGVELERFAVAYTVIRAPLRLLVTSRRGGGRFSRFME